MPAPRRRSAVAVLAVALLTLGLLRMVALVAQVPLAGYANQYDMLRTSACIGLWPDVPPGQHGLATPAAPLLAYRHGGSTGPACYPSTAALLAWIAMTADAAAEAIAGAPVRDFDLRQLGLLYVLLFAAVALALHGRLRDAPAWQLGHGAAFAFILADPVNTLYFNTLYTEPAALLGLYATLALVLHLALGGRPRAGVGIGLVVALAMLGMSRVQHLLLPLPLALIAAALLYGKGGAARAMALLPVAVALAIPAVQLAQQRDSATIAAANRSNTVLGALLPASAAPVRMAARLGLPAECATLEHVSWYLDRGRDVAAECPQLSSVSPARMAWSLLAEPAAAVVLAGRGLAQASAWRLPYLGEVAGRRSQRAPHPSFADWLQAGGFVLHAVLWLAPPLLLAQRALAAVRRRRWTPTDILLCAAVAVVLLVWLSALLGDGYSEFSRHLHLAQSAVVLAWLLLLGGLVRARTRRDVLAPAAAIAVAVLLALLWLRQPLAQGIMEVEPAGEGQLRVHGWALDPSGIAALTLRAGPLRVPLARRPAPDVASIFPLSSDAAPTVARFDALVPRDGATPMRAALWVTGAYGQHSEADALQLGPALHAAPRGRRPVTENR